MKAPDVTRFICDRCGKCCRTHRVPVTHADVRRLEQSGHSRDSFVEFAAPEGVDMTGEPESFARLSEGRRLLLLRHVDRGTGSSCVFWSEDGCLVHPERPMACRTYPFDRPSAPSQPLGLVPGHVCPDDTGVLVQLTRNKKEPTTAAIVDDIDARDRQIREHAAKVAAWNRKQAGRLRLHRMPRGRAELLEELLQES